MSDADANRQPFDPLFTRWLRRAARGILLIGSALAIVWASPYTLLGLLIGLVGLCSGGRVQRRGRAIEFHGGAVTWLLARTPLGPTVLAMTLGHTILGSCSAALDRSREHEHVHVRQYERWGPLFVPAYLLASLVIHLRGGRAYRDNPFEREAYGKADPR